MYFVDISNILTFMASCLPSMSSFENGVYCNLKVFEKIPIFWMWSEWFYGKHTCVWDQRSMTWIPEKTIFQVSRISEWQNVCVTGAGLTMTVSVDAVVSVYLKQFWYCFGGGLNIQSSEMSSASHRLALDKKGNSLSPYGMLSFSLSFFL